MKVVLASGSKSKSNLLNYVWIKHTQMASDFEEKSDKRDNVYEYVKELSLGKARAIEDKVEGSIIIGLDTVCVVDGEIFEKPKTKEDARRYIELSKNNLNQVITGVTLINQLTGEIVNTFAETKVTLRDIQEDDIDFYMNNQPGYMYSSGFIIETMLSNFIDKIEGSFYNILGVPAETIYKYLNKWGYSLKDLNKEVNV